MALFLNLWAFNVPIADVVAIPKVLANMKRSGIPPKDIDTAEATRPNHLSRIPFFLPSIHMLAELRAVEILDVLLEMVFTRVCPVRLFPAETVCYSATLQLMAIFGR